MSLAGSRILLLTLYYAPEHAGSAPYTTALAEHLAARGADVTVITAPPHYPAWQVRPGFPRSRRTERRNGVRVERLPIYIPSSPSLLRRALYEASFVLRALPVLCALFLRRRPALILGCTPGLFAGALATAAGRATGVPVAQVVQDLVTSAAGQSGMRGAAHLSGLFSRLESWTLRHARRITLPTAAFVPVLTGLGVDPQRCVVVPNWSRHEDDGAAVGNGDVRADHGWPGRTVVLHAGNMGLKQGLEELAPTLRRLQILDPTALLVFLGAGSRAETLREATAGLDNVEILPPVPEEEFLPLLRAADVLLVHERSSVRDMSLPSKLTAYFAAGRPVLAVTRSDGATAEEVRRSEAGVVVAPGDPEAFAATLGRLREERSYAEQLGRAGRRYSAEKLGPGPALDRLAAVVEEALAGR